jgi:alpha-tubulin suppressor-like RCC1 family protein
MRHCFQKIWHELRIYLAMLRYREIPFRGFRTGWLFRACGLAGSLAMATSIYASPNVIAWNNNLCCDFAGDGETNVPSDLTNAIAIAAGEGDSLALKSDGTVVAWGLNEFGETNVPSGLTNVIAIAAGYYHNIALKNDGTIVVWGSNDFGQTNVPSGLSNVVAIAGSYYDTMVLKSDGTVLAWGGNDDSQTNIPAGLSNVVAISAGFYDNMALKSDGTVVAWGGGVSAVTNVPADLTNAVAIDCSMSISVEHSLALRSDGTVTAWGYTQAPVPANITNAVAIAAGGVQWANLTVARDLALTADGNLAGWGSITNSPANQSNIVAIACGEFHELALVGNGPPIQTAWMTNPNWSGTNFNVRIPTQSGRVYALEFKNNLSDSNWKALPLVAGIGGIITLQDSSNTNSQRFYRVRRW